MQRLIPKTVFVLTLLIASALAMYPPKEKLRLGKDLQGGASLVYAVQIKPGEDSKEIISKTIEVLKNRVDPDGLSEISMVSQGRDRIEITMPLPRAEVKLLKKAFEDELEKLAQTSVKESKLDEIMRMPAAERDAELTRLAGGNPQRQALFNAVVSTFESVTKARAEYDTAQKAGADKETIDKLIDAAGQAEVNYDEARRAIARASVSPNEVRRAMQLSDQSRGLLDAVTGQMVTTKSPRQKAIDRIKGEHPEALGQIEKIVETYNTYAGSRRTMDDPSDLVRQLKGAGVLNFRIAVKPDWDRTEIARVRQQLKEKGPRGVRSSDVHWYKINQIRNWYNNVQELQMMEGDPEGYFASRGYVVSEYDGEYFMLCYDTRTTRLTTGEGQWGVAGSHETRDEIGRPAIGFDMDPRGAVLLGGLTRDHVGEQMAVILDDEVYTAPTLQQAISKSGRISGDFSPEELRYIIRVLGAGSLQAKLSPEPISINSVGPQLGSDNLRMGLRAGIVSMVLIAAFMIFYYYTSGLIAVVALLANSLLILGAMAMSKAAFTMPGIAGMILTFGQAVDSNVLIYERMREEFHRGADMKTAVRVGFTRAFSPIMDGNVSNLIICVVLYYFGTPEIRGFAITLGIGVVTTLITALVVSRLIFTVLVDYFGWRKTSQLPMTFPTLQRMLTPHIDWMKYRHVLLGGLIVFLAASGVVIVARGSKMLGTEFRGGTEVELQFKLDEKTSNPVTLKREEVHRRLVELAKNAPPGDDARKLADAEVLPVNPNSDGVTSDRFRIRTGPSNERVILAAIANGFGDVIEGSGALTFEGAGNNDWRGRVFQIVSRNLGDNINRPGIRDDVGAYLGGAAVVMQNLTPPPTRESLLARLDRMRQQPEYADTLSRARELRVVEGDDNAVKTAVMLVRDDAVNSFDSTERWEADIAAREWRLANDALTRTTQLASVQTFSPTVAATFALHAVLTVVISLLLLTVYVWVRFGSPRWAIAATVPLFADVVGIAGMIGLAEVLYENPVTGDMARALGLLPFKFDLAQIAALLTIIGYSLNDKIIILDRIRENKGKVPFATYANVNDSINQTLSRTLITAGAHLITTVILYIFGGEAVRGFAFTFNLGVVLGTYTSIVSSPLVWSSRYEREHPAKSLVPA